MQSYVPRTLLMTFLLACLVSLASAAALSTVHVEPKADLAPRVMYDLKDEGSVLTQGGQLSNGTSNLNSTVFRDSQAPTSGASSSFAPALSLIAAGGAILYGLEVAMIL